MTYSSLSHLTPTAKNSVSLCLTKTLTSAHWACRFGGMFIDISRLLNWKLVGPMFSLWYTTRVAVLPNWLE